MRPRLFAAEIVRRDADRSPGRDASMRPRLFAAEIDSTRSRRQWCPGSFNEAAAIRRGNRRPVQLPLDKGLLGRFASGLRFSDSSPLGTVRTCALRVRFLSVFKELPPPRALSRVSRTTRALASATANYTIIASRSIDSKGFPRLMTLNFTPSAGPRSSITM